MEYSKGLSILYLIGDRGLDLTKGEGYRSCIKNHRWVEEERTQGILINRK
jgi:hypothetical protein